MADDAESIRVLLTENSQILGSGEEQEQIAASSNNLVDSESEERGDSVGFAADLKKALGEVVSEKSASSSSADDASETDSGSDSDVLSEQGHCEYVSPLEDPYEKAWKYLSKHNILQLFQGITTDIAYKRPGDPIDYMIDEIEKLQEQDRRRKGVVKLTLPISKPASAKQPAEPDNSHT